MERLTNEAWGNLDPWECCGQDHYCQRGCHDVGGCTKGCIVPILYKRLARYEDTGLEPEEIEAVIEEIEAIIDDAAKEFSEYDEAALKKREAEDNETN